MKKHKTQCLSYELFVRELSKKAQKANNIWWRLSGLLGDRNRQVMYILLPAPGAVHSGNNGPDGPYIPVLPDARGVPDTQGVRLDMERWQLHLGGDASTSRTEAAEETGHEAHRTGEPIFLSVDVFFIKRQNSQSISMLHLTVFSVYSLLYPYPCFSNLEARKKTRLSFFSVSKTRS
jgi:hypothetical protein